MDKPDDLWRKEVLPEMWADLPETRKEAEKLEAEATWWRLQAEMLSKPSDAGEGVTGHGQRVPCTFVDELGGRDTPISEHTFDSVVDESLTGLNRTLPQGRRPGFTAYVEPMRKHHRKDIIIHDAGAIPANRKLYVYLPCQGKSGVLCCDGRMVVVSSSGCAVRSPKLFA